MAVQNIISYTKLNALLRIPRVKRTLVSVNKKLMNSIFF